MCTCNIHLGTHNKHVYLEIYLYIPNKLTPISWDLRLNHNNMSPHGQAWDALFHHNFPGTQYGVWLMGKPTLSMSFLPQADPHVCMLSPDFCLRHFLLHPHLILQGLGKVPLQAQSSTHPRKGQETQKDPDSWWNRSPDFLQEPSPWQREYCNGKSSPFSLF